MQIEEIEKLKKQTNILFSSLEKKYEQYTTTKEEADGKAIALSYLSLISCIRNSEIFDEQMAVNVMTFVNYWKSHVEKRTGKNINELLDRHFG